MTRRSWIPVGLLLAAAAVVWLLVGQSGGDPGLESATGASPIEDDRPAARGGTPQRAPVEPRHEPAPPVTGQTRAPVEKDTEPDPAGEALLHIRAYDRVSKEPLPTFRYTWLQDGERRTGAGEDGLASLAVAPDRPGSLLIEARGYEPDNRTEVTGQAGPEGVEITAYLVPLPDLVGVEITVRDPQGGPVSRVRVDAWSLHPDEEAEAARLRPPLWARRATDEHGVYRLPDLQPGRYHFRVLALGEDDDPLPLLPHRATVTFRGSEHLPLWADLEPGALLALDIVDVTGTPIGAGTGVDVTLSDGSEGEVTWVVEREGERLAARGGLPAAGTASASEPLPPGRHLLRIYRDGELRHTVHIDLAAGERRTERIVLPSRR